MAFRSHAIDPQVTKPIFEMERLKSHLGKIIFKPISISNSELKLPLNDMTVSILFQILKRNK